MKTKKDCNIYLTEKDLHTLNCTYFNEVSHKYGFKYVEDFFNAINETVFVKKDDCVYEIKTEQNHDIYLDYLIGDFLFKINDENNDNIINAKPIKESWGREEVIELLKSMPNFFKVSIAEQIELRDKWIEENL